LSRYPHPLWMPILFIRFLNLIYLKTQHDANWLGARCDRVEYDPRADCWVYTKYLEWRD